MTKTFKVELFVYDMSKGLVKSLSPALFGKQLMGLWHTGICIYEKEYYFGGEGIQEIQPGGTVLGPPDRRTEIGSTEVEHSVFMIYLQELAEEAYRPETYDLLTHNCNTFSNELAQFLVGKSIPAEIINLPQEILSTPLGSLMKPFLAEMRMVQARADTVHHLIDGHPKVSGAVSSALGGARTAASAVGQVVSGAVAGAIDGAKRADADRKRGPSGPSKNKNRNASNSASDDGVEAAPTQQRHLLEKDLCGCDAELFSKARPALLGLLPPSELSLLDEVQEYITTAACPWSLGRPHITLIGRLVRSADLDADLKVAVASLLERAVRRDDIVRLLRREPTGTLVALLGQSDRMSVGVQLALAKAVYICCCDTDGYDWLMAGGASSGMATPTFRSTVCAACVDWLLHDDGQLSAVASRLAHIITDGQIDNKLSVEIGSALIQLTLSDLDDKTAQHVVNSLLSCMRCNNEVVQLARVMGLDPETGAVSASESATDIRRLMSDGQA